MSAPARAATLGVILALAAGCSSAARPDVATPPDVARSVRIERCADNVCAAADAGRDGPMTLDAPDGADLDVIATDSGNDTADGTDALNDAPADATDGSASDTVDAIDAVGPDVPAPVARLVINEIADGPVDWVELYNAGTGAADLGDHVVTIEGAGGTPDLAVAARFPAGTRLPPDEYLVVVAGRSGTDGGASMDCVPGGPTRCFHAGFVVDGSRDTNVVLLAGDSSVVTRATLPMGRTGAGQTWGRLPNGTGVFHLNRPTNGGRNEFAVVVNELQGSSPDFVELYNATDAPVALGDHIVTDSNDDGTVRTSEMIRFVAGTSLGARQFLFVLAGQVAGDGMPRTMCAPSPLPQCYHAIFGISSGRGEMLWLLSPTLDVLSNGLFPSGVSATSSMGRFPDGTGAFTMTPPTPGTANRAM